MKNTLLLVLSCLLCLACTKEDSVPEEVVHISSEDIVLCADNTLALAISLSDAQKKGITPTEYHQVASQLEVLNSHIQQSISSLAPTKSSDNPSVQAFGVLVYNESVSSDEAVSPYVIIMEEDFSIDCTFLSYSEWMTHYLRVSGCVSDNYSLETGNHSEDRFYGFRGRGPGSIQIGYHTNDKKDGICVWSVTF